MFIYFACIHQIDQIFGETEEQNVSNVGVNLYPSD